MKIRTGFVSNSSSTAFIFCFDKVPKSKDELIAQLFPVSNSIPETLSRWGERDDDQVEFDLVIDNFWNSLQFFASKSDEEKLKCLMQELSSDPPYELPSDAFSILSYKKKDQNYDQNIIDYHSRELIEEWMTHFTSDKILAKFNLDQIFICSWEDKGEVETVLEGGQIFNNLKTHKNHVQAVSHH